MNGTHSGRSSVNDYFLKFRNESVFNDKKSSTDCFKYFNKQNKDDFIDLDEFKSLLKALFSFNGNPYSMPDSRITSMFNYFDSKKVTIYMYILIVVKIFNIS
jgi:hypothetical protein